MRPVTIVIIGNLLLIAAAFGQWEPAVRLSESDSASRADDRSLVTRGSYVHAFWVDNYGGSGCIAHRRSTDGGGSWGSTEALSPGVPDRWWCSYGSGSNMLLAFTLGDSLMSRRSTNDGASWGQAAVVAPDAYHCQVSSGAGIALALYGGYDDTAWLRKSSDDGATWSAPVLAMAARPYTYFDTLLHASPYCYYLYSSQDSIFCCRSTDNGGTWLTPVCVRNSENVFFNMQAALDDAGRLHLGWEDNHTGNMEVFYIRSTDHGASWTSFARLTISSAGYFYWIRTMDDMVYVGLFDMSSQQTRRRSFDGGASWEHESVWPGYSPAYALCVPGENAWLHLFSWDFKYGQLAEGYGYCVCYNRSKNAGTSWCDSSVTLSDVDMLNRYPRAAVRSQGNVLVLWEDYKYGNYEVMFRRGVGLAGVEEDPEPLPLSKPRPTLVSTQGAVRDAQSGILFDATGRRVVNPRPGVYFVRGPLAKNQSAPPVRRIVITR